jgi:uncharacterized protein with von Willebrand factor type A (vWA) domain
VNRSETNQHQNQHQETSPNNKKTEKTKARLSKNTNSPFSQPKSWLTTLGDVSAEQRKSNDSTIQIFDALQNGETFDKGINKKGYEKKSYHNW